MKSVQDYIDEANAVVPRVTTSEADVPDKLRHTLLECLGNGLMHVRALVGDAHLPAVLVTVRHRALRSRLDVRIR